MIDIRAVELMCSRLCHDLISPVGAIRNGLEILEEADEAAAAGATEQGFRAEALQLIAHAAGQADSRLRLFRLAYGQAGRDLIGFGTARQAAADWFAGGRTQLVWLPGTPPDAFAGRPGLVKVLLNLLVVGAEALTHGGMIAVTSAGTVGEGEIFLGVDGRPGQLSDELSAALAGAVATADLSPRAIHAYITGVFANTYELKITVTPHEVNRMVMRLSWTS